VFFDVAKQLTFKAQAQCAVFLTERWIALFTLETLGCFAAYLILLAQLAKRLVPLEELQ
jgi:hypothetical protein